jgi:hypothetical protein
VARAKREELANLQALSLTDVISRAAWLSFSHIRYKREMITSEYPIIINIIIIVIFIIIIVIIVYV